MVKLKNSSEMATSARFSGSAPLPGVVQMRRARLEKSLASDIPAKAEGDLSIKEINGWILREPVSKRRYTVVKIRTASGLIGFGECAPIWSAEFEAAKKLMLGIPVTSFDVTSALLSKCTTARAAINIAMLDAVGKACKAPVFQVLGGPTRHKARVLAQLKGDSDTDLTASMNRAKEAGYNAFIVPVPAITTRNQGQAFVVATRKRLETLRTAGGQNIDFVLDGEGRLTPGDAQMLSEELQKFHLLWFNEPCPPLASGAFRKIAGESVTPVGLGKFITEGGAIQDLLREDAVDIIRPDIGLNGITQIRKMAAIAEVYYVAAGPVHNGGPVGTAAALHLAASIPNFFIVEIPFPEAQEDRAMRLSLTASPVEVIKEGFAVLPSGAGLGINVNEQNLERYKEAVL